MPRVTLELHGVLAWLLGMRSVEVEARTVRDVIEWIRRTSPKAGNRVWDCRRNDLAPDVVILVNDVDTRLLKGLDTELRDGDRVAVITYIHGG